LSLRSIEAREKLIPEIGKEKVFPEHEKEKGGEQKETNEAILSCERKGKDHHFLQQKRRLANRRKKRRGKRSSTILLTTRILSSKEGSDVDREEKEEGRGGIEIKANPLCSKRDRRIFE